MKKRWLCESHLFFVLCGTQTTDIQTNTRFAVVDFKYRKTCNILSDNILSATLTT